MATTGAGFDVAFDNIAVHGAVTVVPEPERAALLASLTLVVIAAARWRPKHNRRRSAVILQEGL